MKDDLINEIDRLKMNAARRREDLQVTGLRKAKGKKVLTLAAGILALTSASAITIQQKESKVFFVGPSTGSNAGRAHM